DLEGAAGIRSYRKGVRRELEGMRGSNISRDTTAQTIQIAAGEVDVFAGVEIIGGAIESERRNCRCTELRGGRRRSRVHRGNADDIVEFQVDWSGSRRVDNCDAIDVDREAVARSRTIGVGQRAGGRSAADAEVISLARDGWNANSLVGATDG